MQIGIKKDNNIRHIGNKFNHSLHGIGRRMYPISGNSNVPHIVSPSINIIDAHNSNSQQSQREPTGLNNVKKNKTSSKSKLEK